MPAIISTIVLPAVTKGPSAFVRLLGAACEVTADYLGRRIAIACLHGLDDRALDDIGLARFQIEAAVCGLVPLSGQTDEGMLAYAAAANPRMRQPALEVASWN
jgi:uncharacterized protein YjiS (DUF1127 family)